jgi:hypothetical protein
VGHLYKRRHMTQKEILIVAIILIGICECKVVLNLDQVML